MQKSSPWLPAAFKAACFATMLAALWLTPNLDLTTFQSLNVRWPRQGAPTFASHFATWDAAHYLRLSELGYGPGVLSCAFYPLWPLLIRWSAPLTGGSHVAAGLLLANLFSLAAWMLLYRIVRRRWGAQAAAWTLVWLIAFPGSLFYQFLYTESLFLLLVMLLWWGLENRRAGLAGAAAGLLPLTRAVGLFCLLPIGWHLLTVHPPAWLRDWARRWPWLQGLGLPGHARDAVPQPAADSTSTPYWLLLAPLVGWGAYLWLMWHWTGNPFEGFEAQKNWKVHAISNLWNVPKFLAAFITPTRWHAFEGSLLDRCVFVLLVYCLPAIWRLDASRGLMVWTYVLGILPAMSGAFTSYTRFASCAFPMFLALAVFLAPPERRWLRWGLLAVFAALHIVLAWRYVNFRWAG